VFLGGHFSKVEPLEFIDPSGFHQLPIAGSDGDTNTPNPRYSFEIMHSFGGSKFLNVIGSFATSQWWS